jgi:DNA-directed RNA polymerase beta' subunit
MDQVGLPEHLAWNVFAPSVVRRMVRNGMSRMEAVEEVEKRTDRARRSLLEEMNVRPVTMTRYPVLHKFNVMGFWPKLVAGDAIHTNPAVNKSYAMDHDGDTVTVHAPVDDSAIERIKKNMMPSRNVRSPADFHAGVYMPNMEFLLGVYHASTAKKDQAPRTFRSRQDVMNAYAKGEITVDTPVTILG